MRGTPQNCADHQSQPSPSPDLRLTPKATLSRTAKGRGRWRNRQCLSKHLRGGDGEPANRLGSPVPRRWTLAKIFGPLPGRSHGHRPVRGRRPGQDFRGARRGCAEARRRTGPAAGTRAARHGRAAAHRRPGDAAGHTASARDGPAGHPGARAAHSPCRSRPCGASGSRAADRAEAVHAARPGRARGAGDTRACQSASGGAAVGARCARAGYASRRAAGPRGTCPPARARHG